MKKLIPILWVLLFIPFFSFGYFHTYEGNIKNDKVFCSLHNEGFFESSNHLSYCYLTSSDDYSTKMISLHLTPNATNPWQFDGMIDNKKDAIIIFQSIALDYADHLKADRELHLIWTDLQTSESFPVELVRIDESAWDDESEYHYAEIRQEEELDDKYFTVIVSKIKNRHPVVTGVNVYRKQNDQLIQTIDGLGELTFNDTYSIKIDDYNFDGVMDLAISHNWADGLSNNHAYSYYAYNSQIGQFIPLDLFGYDVEFKSENKSAISFKSFHSEIDESIEYALTEVYQYDGNKYRLIESYCEHYFYSESEQVKKRQCTEQELQFSLNTEPEQMSY